MTTPPPEVCQWPVPPCSNRAWADGWCSRHRPEGQPNGLRDSDDGLLAQRVALRAATPDPANNDLASYIRAKGRWPESRAATPDPAEPGLPDDYEAEYAAYQAARAASTVGAGCGHEAMIERLREAERRCNEKLVARSAERCDYNCTLCRT